MKFLLTLLLISLASVVNASSSLNSSPESVEASHPDAQKRQSFKKAVLDDFHSLMAKVVSNWNELGTSVNKVADNIDNNLTDNGQYPGRPWPIALSSILLENVNVQMRSIIVQIAEGLLRVNHKKGGKQGPAMVSSSQASSQEGSGSVEPSEAAHPKSPHHLQEGKHGEKLNLSKLLSDLKNNQGSEEQNSQGKNSDSEEKKSLEKGLGGPDREGSDSDGDLTSSADPDSHSESKHEHNKKEHEQAERNKEDAVRKELTKIESLLAVSSVDENKEHQSSE